MKKLGFSSSQLDKIFILSNWGSKIRCAKRPESPLTCLENVSGSSNEPIRMLMGRLKLLSVLLLML